MIIRALQGGDWTFGKGLANYNQAEAAIEENIATRVLSWIGDCFWALAEGVDWRNRLDARQQSDLLEEVKTVILQSFGVIGINSVNAVFNGLTRNYVITYNIQTIYSQSFESMVVQNSGVTN